LAARAADAHPIRRNVIANTAKLMTGPSGKLHAEPIAYSAIDPNQTM